MRLTLLSADQDHPLWQNLLSKMSRYDSYHTADYALLSDTLEPSFLLLWQQEEAQIALPVIIREIPQTKGWKDLTSAYGYPGPVGSPQVTKHHFAFFMEDLQKWMNQEQIVSLFSRLHPFEERIQEWIPSDQLFFSNKTVYLPLQGAHLPSCFDQNHRRDIETLVNRGYTPEINPLAIEEFHEIYHQTMIRKQASATYCFDRSYFRRLIDAKDFESILITVSDDQKVIAGGLFLFCSEGAQYHLGAVRDGYQNLSLLKLIIFKAATIASQRGIRTLHLGGGYNGSDRDGLFEFKSKFSRHYADFYTWRWIVDQKKYQALSQDKESTSYFPRYRS